LLVISVRSGSGVCGASKPRSRPRQSEADFLKIAEKE
jgi:hypothetical protein